MKRHSQWMAMAMMAGALGVSSATGQVFTESWDNEPIAEERIITQGSSPVILQERETTTRRNAWVARRDQLRTARSGYVLIEGRDRGNRALMETTPVVSREVIELEPVAEKRKRCSAKPMRQVFIRERLAPVAEGPLHSGPATVREHRRFTQTYIPPRFHSSKASRDLEPVAEKTTYRVKRSVKKSGEPLRTSTRRVTVMKEELEPVAEQTVTIEPIYERIDTRPQRAGWSIFNFGNPYR